MTTNITVEKFRSASRQVIRELGFFRTQYEGTGVTSAQAHILMELGEKAPLGLNEIIEKVRMDKSSASRTLHRLVGKELVATTPQDGDQRLKLFDLTRKGRKTLKEIDSASLRIVEKAFKCLTPSDNESVREGMLLYSRALRESRLLSEFDIRPIQSKDNNELNKLIKSILLKEFDESNQEVVEMLPEIENLHKFYDAPRRKYFVVLRDGNIKGGAGIGPLSGGSPNICEIQKMYLERSIRGKGLGSKLLRMCLDFAKASGYSECYLDTRENMIAAQRLYERHGFKQLQKPLGTTGHAVCDRYYFLSLK